MAITNKNDLVEYIKRQLGSPVINIEIADEQIDDIIDDALDLFREYHADALKLKWVFLDITTDIQTYNLDSSIFSIVDVFGYNSQSLYGFDSEDQGYLMKSAYVGNSGFGFNDEYNSSDIEVIRQQYALYKSQISRDYVFNYSYLEREFKLLVDIERNETIAILCYSYLDNADKNYSSLWFRRYCTALSGLAWAQNIGKFTGTSLPGASQFNYGDIFSKYDAMRIQLEEEIIDRYSSSFFMSIG